MKPMYTNPDNDYQKIINACRFKNIAKNIAGESEQAMEKNEA